MKIISTIELFIVALIWGTAFVAQSVGMDYLGPCAFNASRFTVGAIILIPVIFLVKAMDKKEGKSAQYSLHDTIKGGICCGCAMAAATLFQQFGLLYTTVGKAGFGTSLYIIIVPFLAVVLGKKITGRTWLAAIIAIVGFYFMCISETMTINKGDLLVLVCAILWSVHIHIVDHFAPRANGVMMSSIQFAVSALICTTGALLTESFTWSDIAACSFPILYAGVMSCGIAYTLQIIAQKNVEPTIACLIMSLESVFSALAGLVILGEKMSAIEVFGCALVFTGVIIAQLPGRTKVES